MGGFMRGEGGAGFGAVGGGGGSAVDYGLTALIAPAGDGGNDTTGTVGDFTKPYATPQAAYDDGARTFELLPAASYGGITATGAIAIAIRSHGYAGGAISFGAISSSDGGAITVLGLSSRDSLEVASITTAGGAVTLKNFRVAGSVSSFGGNGVNAAGVYGGNVVLRNMFVGVDVAAYGGSGASGDVAEEIGYPGGYGGTIALEDCDVGGLVSSYGGAGGTGAASDSGPITNGAAGGEGGGGAAITITRSRVGSNVSAAGGEGGTGGAGDSGNSLSNGNGGNGGAGAAVTVTDSSH